MSVPASQRSASSLQYIDSARRLAKHIFSYANRIPKRYWQRLSNPLCEHATEVLFHVQSANRIYVKSEADYEHRRYHLLEALSNLDHVAALLDLAFDVQESPNENAFSDLAAMIDRERKLIGGVMRKDRDARR